MILYWIGKHKRFVLLLLVLSALSIMVLSQCNSQTNAMDIARGLHFQMKGQVDDSKLGQAVGNVREGRRSMEAYRLAHTEISKNGYYKGLSEDHIPLLQVLIADLEKQRFRAIDNGLSFDKRSDQVLSEFTLASKAVNDSWR